MSRLPRRSLLCGQVDSNKTTCSLEVDMNERRHRSRLLAVPAAALFFHLPLLC